MNVWAAVFTNDVPVPLLSDFSWLVGTTGDFFSHCSIGSIGTYASCSEKIMTLEGLKRGPDPGPLGGPPLDCCTCSAANIG